MITPIPSTWLWMGTGAILAALGVALAVQTTRVAEGEARLDRAKADWASEREGLATKALAAETSLRALEEAQREKEREASRVAQKSLSQLQLELDTARAAGDSLRNRFATLTRSCAASGTGTGATTGAPGPSAGDLLADVLGRLDTAAGEIARFADQTLIDARSCEAVH